jgi:hypothetical protein
MDLNRAGSGHALRHRRRARRPAIVAGSGWCALGVSSSAAWPISQQAAARGLVWKPEKAQRVIDFFAEVLCLPERHRRRRGEGRVTKDGDDPRQPFILRRSSSSSPGRCSAGTRRPGIGGSGRPTSKPPRAQGKTPFGAGLMLYMLVADGERGAQVYAAATSRDQAKLAFTDAERMVEASPARRASRPEGQQPRGARDGIVLPADLRPRSAAWTANVCTGPSSTSSTSIATRSSSTRCGRAPRAAATR